MQRVLLYAVVILNTSTPPTAYSPSLSFFLLRVHIWMHALCIVVIFSTNDRLLLADRAVQIEMLCELVTLTRLQE